MNMETKVNTIIKTDQSISSQPLCISLTHNEIKDIAFVLYQKTERLKSDCLSQQHTIDAEKEKLQDMQEVNTGLMPKWKYKVKWQGMTEEQAKAEIAYEDEAGIDY